MGGFPNFVLLEKAHDQIALCVRKCHGLEISKVKYTDTYEPRCEKTGLRSHRRWLDA